MADDDKPLTFEEALKRIENSQHLDFVLAYVSCGFNGARAAREARYSESTARQQASRLLTYADIRAAVDAFMRERVMGANEIEHRLTQIARGSIDPFVADNVEDGYLVDFTLPDAREHTHLIKEVDVRQRVIEDGDEIVEVERHTKLKLHDPLVALDKLARIRGMYRERLDLNHSGQAQVQVYIPSNGRERAEEE